jgi:hypothetical protein
LCGEERETEKEKEKEKRSGHKEGRGGPKRSS